MINFHSINFRLLRYSLASSLFLSLFIILAQFLYEVRNERDRIDKLTSFVEKSYGSTIAKQLWNLETTALQSSLNGILNVEYLVGVKVEEIGTNRHYKAGVFSLQLPYSQFKTFDVKSKIGSAQTKIGKVILRFDWSLVLSRMLARLLYLSFFVFLTTTLILSSLYLIYDKTLNRHLGKIIEFISSGEKVFGLPELKLNRSRTTPKENDELDRLVDQLNYFVFEINKREQQQKALQDKSLEMASHIATAKTSSGILHNVRNFIHIGYMSFETMKGHLNERHGDLKDAKINRYLQRIDSAFENASNLISSQQQLAHTEASNNILDIELKEFIRTALNLSEHMLKMEQVTTEFKMEKSPTIRANKAVLVNTFLNIIKNSCEAMTSKPPSQKSLKITGETVGLFFYLRFDDSGEGLEAEKVDKIFKHGFSSKKGGHGFGLSSCKKQLNKAFGDLHFTSEGASKGATVTLVLPITEHFKEIQDLHRKQSPKES